MEVNGLCFKSSVVVFLLGRTRANSNSRRLDGRERCFWDQLVNQVSCARKKDQGQRLRPSLRCFSTQTQSRSTSSICRPCSCIVFGVLPLLRRGRAGGGRLWGGLVLGYSKNHTFKAYKLKTARFRVPLVGRFLE